MRALIVALLAVAIGGCAVVPRYARGALAEPGMDRRGDVLADRALRKIHQTREAASGGDGLAAGGGCGCGN